MSHIDDLELAAKALLNYKTDLENLGKGIVSFRSYTVAGLPTGATGDLVYCTNGAAGSPCLAVKKGSIWAQVAIGNVVSAT